MLSSTVANCFPSDRLGRREVIGREPCIVAGADEVGHIIFGPYETKQPGHYRVDFRLAVGTIPDGRLGDFVCAVVDVVANTGAITLAKRQVRVSELTPALTTVSVEFTLHAPRAVEYRVWNTGQCGIASTISPQVSEVSSTSSALKGPEREWANEAEFLDGYLRNVTGLIHIGANTGQERRFYQVLGLDVLWVEAMEDVYQILLDNIAPFARQRAVRALLADVEGVSFEFNVSSHGGGSSSILPFQDHSVIMPDIKYVECRQITSTTFGRMVDEASIDLSLYQAVTLDAEGAELLILKGAGDLLRSFRYIQCEVSDFPSRTGAPTSADLDELLRPLGFEQLIRRPFAYGPNGNGTYWDIVWKRQEGDLLQAPNVSLPMIANDPNGWEHRLSDFWP